MIIQIRSKKIEFADFLFKKRVSFVISPVCICEYFKQTIKHVLLFCNDRRNKHKLKQEECFFDFRIFTDTVKNLKNSVDWLIRENVLPQFSLAVKTLESLNE